MMKPYAIAALALLLIQTPARGGGCTPPGSRTATARFHVQQKPYRSLADFIVKKEHFGMGALVPKATPVLSISSPAVDRQLKEIGKEMSELKLQLQNYQRLALVNKSSLSVYSDNYGRLDDQTLRTILRKDDIDILNERIANLKKAERSERELYRRQSGVFDQDIFLVSEPPHAGEAVGAGTVVFEYIELGRLALILSEATTSSVPKETIRVRIDAACLDLKLAKASVDTKRRIKQSIYVAVLNRRQSEWLARQLRSGNEEVEVFL